MASGRLVLPRASGPQSCLRLDPPVQKDPLEPHQMRVHTLDTNNSPHFPASAAAAHPRVPGAGARFPLPNAQDANQRINVVLSYRLSPSQHFRLHLGLRVGRSE